MNRMDPHSRYLGGEKRLLIIASNVDLLQFLKDHYSKRDYKILCLSSSENIVQTITGFSPHVVLMSVTFFELLRKIREVDEFCSILLFASNENTESELDKFADSDVLISDGAFHIDAREHTRLPELLLDIEWAFDSYSHRFRSKYLGGSVFVLMPFSKEFDQVYYSGIKPSVEGCGLTCERVDEQHFTDSILNAIFENIEKARFVVAEMTGKNPNVFYEVGYAHAMSKPVVLITDNVKDIPFDLKHKPHVEYNGNLAVLKAKLTKRLRGLIEKRVGWKIDSKRHDESVE